VATEQGSTVPRRRLGRELRRLRESAQLTIEAVMKDLEWSRQKIWRIERGDSAMRAFDVEAMCKVYGASEEMTDALKALAKETKAKGWYHSFGDVIPKWFIICVDLEDTAARHYGYSSELVPGLLQTWDYARAIFATSVTLSPTELERSVQVRVSRQKLLDKEGVKFNWLLNEAVVRRLVGGPEVMAAQLRHLAKINERNNMSIRVLPFSIGAHSAMVGSFRLLDFAKGTEPTTVHVEGLTGDLYLDKRKETEPYRKLFETTAETALSKENSTEFLLSIAEEFSSG
jgi:transcriptional regulator with XRE-family HTH domain